MKGLGTPLEVIYMFLLDYTQDTCVVKKFEIEMIH